MYLLLSMWPIGTRCSDTARTQPFFVPRPSASDFNWSVPVDVASDTAEFDRQRESSGRRARNFSAFSLWEAVVQTFPSKREYQRSWLTCANKPPCWGAPRPSWPLSMTSLPNPVESGLGRPARSKKRRWLGTHPVSRRRRGGAGGLRVGARTPSSVGR